MMTQTTAGRTMGVSSTVGLPKLDAILYDRPAGRSIVGYAIETIETLRAESLSRFDEMTRRNNRIIALEKQLAEALAEVERLRPAAEAWEKQEHYDSLRTAPMAEVLSADRAMKVAASVARAERAARKAQVTA